MERIANMLTRRAAIRMTAAFAVVAAPSGLVRRAWAAPGEQAVDFIKITSDQLVAIVNGADSAQDKRRRLQAVIDTAVGVEDIARFCLGRFWATAPRDQQAQYVTLFGELLVTEIAAHLGEYQGVRVTVESARTNEGTEIVLSIVARPNNPATQVDWVVSTATGAPKIVDLLAGGTSMRMTQSADFSAYLSHHQYSVQQLIEGMRLQLAQGGP
jgi:phospholipid transport system substrate-binding protein